MFGLRLLSSMLVVGTLIVPGHWCCLVDMGAEPCCHAATAKIEPVTRSCCQKTANDRQSWNDSASSVHSKTIHSKNSTPESMVCCCDTGNRTAPTPTSVVTSPDVQFAYAAASFVAPVATDVVQLADFSVWPPTERLQARLCCWRC